MAKIEIILESNQIKMFKRESIKSFKQEIDSKIAKLRSKDCHSEKTLISELIYSTHGMNCGFGCQMHMVVSGFICATDLNRLFLIKNYEKASYNKYFSYFDKKCENMTYSKNYLGIY